MKTVRTSTDATFPVDATLDRAATPRLQIRTFGRAEVLVDGQSAEWHAASAQDLCFYLLSFPAGRTRAQILDDLWGLEADHQSGNRFRVTLHRLRGALGLPNSVNEAYGRYSLSPEVFQASDVQQFYAALQRADRAADSQERMAAYRQVLDTYAGEYLPEFQTEWARQARQEHQAAFVRACTDLSAVYCELSDCREAVSTLTQALKLDPFIGENYHQKLMTCLSVTENRYAAIEHYRRFIRFLQDDLQDTPMSETAQLAERVKSGEHICKKMQGQEAPSTYHCPLTVDGVCPGGMQQLLQLT
ncbi:AfsR/SARP family transcriptional regulator [Deinococcus ruber]|uniref:Bacterial transcriptional activator domain-containing protein n=1 Tax=Deinococcus ruber TaxID=1848197 RepID=A0A918F5F7_9DEIO|nr:bacterial transcriptional activator domain-containing protein [Deinococcus ruber]GGR03043.1 hypothetical protein GCM10008957_14850 [Deinococcus ruber]